MKYCEGHEQEYQRRLQTGRVAWDAGAYEAFDMLPWLRACLNATSFEAPAPKALDLGCGTGALAVYLAQQGFDVDAVDIAPSAIEEAKKQAALRDAKATFRVGDVCEMDFPEKHYDLITDNHFLHCIVFEQERQLTLSRIRSLLKKGGHYWIETMVGHPDMKPRPEWNLDEQGIAWAVMKEGVPPEGSLNKSGAIWVPVRRIRPSSQAMAEELHRAGFEILQQETAPPADENDTGCFRARCRRASRQ